MFLDSMLDQNVAPDNSQIEMQLDEAAGGSSMNRAAEAKVGSAFRPKWNGVRFIFSDSPHHKCVHLGWSSKPLAISIFFGT